MPPVRVAAETTRAPSPRAPTPTIGVTTAASALTVTQGTSGTGGAWNAVTPSGTTTRVYSFNISGRAGRVAYAIPQSGRGTVGVSFFQQAQTSNTWTVTMSRSYSGSGATWTLAVPNVAGVSGFNTAWGLANASTNWSLTGLGGLFAPGNNALGFGEGGTFRSAARTGTVSP
ncbi:MAG: hypothetical protein ACK6DR_13400 [Gemmatimonas sp.]|uniref:hypothetical protein n=1 Tax=Gemmatimonas sp. TaxID=1962908 RepID=UPI0025BBA466|nr:hypothetical protein [Gemmatimonas sp.]MCA2995749.1 hypothetical protein [Gemmatimonas sp.]MCE2953141.1 hypothetical protein [Gemmatimonas sp.]